MYTDVFTIVGLFAGSIGGFLLSGATPVLTVASNRTFEIHCPGASQFPGMAPSVYLLGINIKAVRIIQISISDIVLDTVGWLNVDKSWQLLQKISSIVHCQFGRWLAFSGSTSLDSLLNSITRNFGAQPVIWVESSMW